MYRGRHALLTSTVPEACSREHLTSSASSLYLFSRHKEAESVSLISFDSKVEALSVAITPTRPPALDPFTSPLDPSPPSLNTDQPLPSVDSMYSVNLTNPFASPSDSISTLCSDSPSIDCLNERYTESPFNVCPTLRLESRTKSVETLETDVPPVVLDHVAENGCVIPHRFGNEHSGTADSLCAATGCVEDTETGPGVSSLASRVRSQSSLQSPFTENTRCQPGFPMPLNSIDAPVTPEISAHVTYNCMQQRFFIPSHSRASSVDSDASLDPAWGSANPRTQFDSPTSERLHYRATSWTDDAYQPLLTVIQPRSDDDAPRHLRLVASAEALLAPHRPRRAVNRPCAGSYVGTSAISAGPSLTPSPLRPVYDHPTSVDLSPLPAQGHLDEANHQNSPSSARKKSIKVLWTTGGPILLPTDSTKPTHVRGLSGCFPPVPRSPPTRPLPPAPRHSIEPSRSFGNLVNGHATTPVKVEAALPGDDYPRSPQLWSRDVSLQSLSDHLTVRVPGRLPNPPTADKENQRTLTLSTTARALHSLRQLASKARNKRPTALDVFATGNDEVSLLQDA